ncbi:unnamed protein product [Protopolystoma xenopodis]|uniref:Uncharacterized protein n=1 Tax=Protopolystoma xenopodis TaxID=117903 RepID=A0A448XF71_9PLAT|nr:unnamed protein product [Protopolystoma xenopodis]
MASSGLSSGPLCHTPPNQIFSDLAQAKWSTCPVGRPRASAKIGPGGWKTPRHSIEVSMRQKWDPVGRVLIT